MCQFGGNFSTATRRSIWRCAFETVGFSARIAAEEDQGGPASEIVMAIVIYDACGITHIDDI